MELEDQIKELEKKLELKRAYLDVNISFPKGNKLSQEIKDEVIKLIKETCNRAAEGKSQVASEALPFSEDEVTILKQVVAQVKTAAGKSPTSTSSKAVFGPEVPDATANSNKFGEMVRSSIKTRATQNTAQLLLLDNLDRSLKDKVESGAIVKVLAKRDENTMFVEANNGIRFNIPTEDLDFNYQEEK